MNGKILFLVTLVIAVLFSGAALAAGVADAETGWRIGLGLAGIWLLWLVALLYLAGGAITHRRDAGRAGTSIVLALLLTPLVVAAPVVSAAGSLVNSFSDVGASTVDSEVGAGIDDTPIPPVEEYPQAPGAGLTPDDVEIYYLPEGVARADLSAVDWQDFYDCVTTSPYPGECSIGSGE